MEQTFTELEQEDGVDVFGDSGWPGGPEGMLEEGEESLSEDDEVELGEDGEVRVGPQFVEESVMVADLDEEEAEFLKATDGNVVIRERVID